MSTGAIKAGPEGDGLAVVIRREHEAASSAAQSAVDHAMECGRLLAQAREGIAHGGWEAFVRDRCGVPPRTARVYLRLDANRERLANRQRVAGLTVREAVRSLTVPKAQAAVVDVATARTRHEADAGNALRLAVPSWYRHGHIHAGLHPSGWCFEVWPHPHGTPWVHFFIMSNVSGYPSEESGGALVGPKCGIRSDALPWAMERQCVNGMPPLDDPGWRIASNPVPVDAATIAAEPYYNSWLFRDEDDYRRRGMGIDTRRRNARQGAPA